MISSKSKGLGGSMS